MLVQPLFDGPLDFIGDVHGEIEALAALLEHLGYDSHGRHREGRRLVFLGDLTDRGPDSPAVVRLVRSLIEGGAAQCVLGNHDLHALLGLRKYDNPWFHGEEFYTPDGRLLPQALADEQTRATIVGFFATLPIALERPDTRAIHAHWDAAMIEIAREGASVVELYHAHHEILRARHAQQSELDLIARELDLQNRHPIRLLTSGPEQKAPKAYEMAGAVRHLQRVHWWREYREKVFCIFGHYGILHGKPRSFGRAFCVDFGVGKRSLERLNGPLKIGSSNDGRLKDAPMHGGPLKAGTDASLRFRTRLAALRMPEQRVHFDDGSAELWIETRG